MAISINTVVEDVRIRRFLFLAPHRNYATAVVKNLSAYCEKEGVRYTARSVGGNNTPAFETDRCFVAFVCCDPVEWTKFTFTNVDRIFGEKNLMKTAKSSFSGPFAGPKEHLDKAIVHVNKIANGEYDAIPSKTSYLPEISKVHFNPPMTIVLWADGTKTMVRCQEGDVYSDEVGLALCIAKKALGNKGNFNNVFRKWVPEELEDDYVDMPENPLRSFLDKLAANVNRSNKEETK